MRKVFTKPHKWNVFFKQFLFEMNKLGVNSIWIVIIISFFIGAVIVVQIKLNIDSPFLPRFTVGFVSREIMILEFSSSIMCLILAGKIGSNIASEIGTMKITEQIDALEIMGVNSANYIILPKIAAFMAFIPVLVVLSIFFGVVGGFSVCVIGHVMDAADYQYGIQTMFKQFYIWYAILKTIVFAFIISSVASFYGYFVKGGSLDVGKASTDSVVVSSILICGRGFINYSIDNGMIEIKNLVKSFDGRDVLKGVSMAFEEGKVNLIIGQSGSGKTVLLKNLIGLIRPTSGSILYDERDLTKMSLQEMKGLRQEMGMIFQGSALFDSMTVAENVGFPLLMFSSLSKEDQAKRVKYCLNRVNLSDAGHLLPSEISGGMMKRAAIARAIALNPRYLFCDEPNSGLDPQTSLVIDDLIESITREYKMTTVINTHDMNSVMNIGEHIFFIKLGNLEWVGTNKEIMSSNNQALNDFVFASDLFKKVREAEEKGL